MCVIPSINVIVIIFGFVLISKIVRTMFVIPAFRLHRDAPQNPEGTLTMGHNKPYAIKRCVCGNNNNFGATMHKAYRHYFNYYYMYGYMSMGIV